ncbi:hypothetical protein JCM33774_24050 [Actinophytocola sp. KF-1]
MAPVSASTGVNMSSTVLATAEKPITNPCALTVRMTDLPGANHSHARGAPSSIASIVVTCCHVPAGRARDAGADMVRVATHCTEADVSPQHFAAARDLGMETAGS